MLGTIFLYNFILLGSTLFVYLSEKERTALGRALCTTIAFFIVFLPAAFRFEIGRDYFSYQRIFNQIADGIYSGNIESGYYFLNWLVASLGLSYEWLVGLVAFFIYFIAFLSYPKKNRTVFHFFFLTFFYFTSFNLLRSMLVASLTLFGCMRYMENRSKTQFMLTILLASLFHITALLFIIFPFLNWKVIRQALYARPILFLTAALFFIFAKEIIQFAFESPIAEFMGFSQYGKSEYFTSETEIRSGIGILIKFSLLFIPFIFIRHINTFFKTNTILFFVIAACILSLILAVNINIFSRLERLYSVGYIFSAYIISCSPRVPFRWGVLLIYAALYFAVYNLDILRGSTNHLETCEGSQITPYISVFNKEDSKRDPRYTWKIAHCEAHMNQN